ncbi:hypothetical protein ACFW04_011930 [Cataglyphis niger]
MPKTITQPPEANKYEIIKMIGDRKLLQLLRHLRTFAANNVLDSLLCTLWLGRYPHQMQIILAT